MEAKQRTLEEAIEHAENITKNNTYPFITKVNFLGGELEVIRPGISKREYYAGLAMQALIGKRNVDNTKDMILLADESIRMADALIIMLAGNLEK